MNQALAIFSKYPRQGRVKTRLGRDIGEAAALALHTAFLLDTESRTRSLPARRFLFLADCSPAEAREFTRLHNLPADLEVREQQGRDLGERLWNAFQELHPDCQHVVFIGIDSPTLPLRYLQAAFAALHDVPVVLGPVGDGGYYLLGLSRPIRRIFNQIAWGSSHVLCQTREKLARDEYRLLPPWFDVDILEDARRLNDELAAGLEKGDPRPRCTEQVLATLELSR